MERLCKELTDTYNTNVIDNQGNEFIAEEFMKAASMNKDSGKGKSVLINLIYNHYSPDVKKPEPLFIGGPANLTVHWSNTHKKIIYTFGEAHTDVMDCHIFQKGKELEDNREPWDRPNSKLMSVEYFFKRLGITTDSFIDFLIEVPATEMKSKGYHPDFEPFSGKLKNYRMSKIFEYFKECIDYPTRSGKRCSLFRVHYFDARYNDKDSAFKGANIISSFRLDVQSLYQTVYAESIPFAYKKLLEDKQEYVEMFKSLGSSDDKTIFSYLISQVIGNKYTNKELGKVEDKEIRKFIIEFLQEENRKYMNTYKLLWRTHCAIVLKILKPSDEDYPTSKEFEESFDYIYKSLTNLNGVVTDVYLLSRLFKVFDLTKMEEKAYTGATDQPAKATNVVIYAGDAHAARYRNFLEKKLDFKQLAETGLNKTNKDGGYPNCIDMKTIPQPFFNFCPFD
jgi:hypothetical protein